MEKRIASLESERKSFGKGRADAEFRLSTISHDIQNNEAAMERMKADYEKYSSVVQRDKDGNPVNNLTVDGCKFKDEQNMGVHLQGLAQRTDTHGQYQRVGEVYGFPISIISEHTLIDGREGVQNRFVVEGSYKYKYNNGFIAMSDTHAACMNFVNALEKIPGIVEQYEERTAKLKADVPILEGIVAKQWGKEEELKQLKSELAALDRKITAELKPSDAEEAARAKVVTPPKESPRCTCTVSKSGLQEVNGSRADNHIQRTGTAKFPHHNWWLWRDSTRRVPRRRPEIVDKLNGDTLEK